ncbi:MAG: DUF87 domain-containing protein [Acidobacteriota bacterium]
MSLQADIYEKLGAFYLGRPYDLKTGEGQDEALLYDSKDLLTHAVCVGMTGSGKTGLCVCLLEEAAMDGVPALIIDPKGDLGNLLLTFPDLSPEEFRPWVDEDAARRAGKTPEEFAAAQAELWRNGLGQWGQTGERIRRLREKADFAIYTPGSDAGRPVSVLSSFSAPPPELVAEADLLRERVAVTVQGLLGLIGIDADPVQSREHILLANLFERAWRSGLDLDLGQLIHQVQNPPMQKVGVLPIDSFFPQKDRFGLAMALNNLLASPGFSTWMSGEPLDVDRLLYNPEGKPRVAIFSIAHLGDAERMFFVTLLLNQTLGWMRSRPGTSSLRALLYMDEVFGYLPPVANPPSKQPLLTMLKQARAFGLGLVLATQNPVDLDYKALSNIGTWFLGRLQTERDKARVLDGLEGAAASAAGFDRQAMEEILAGLGKRVFLLHNVHEDGPEIFQTRWAMSYLRGPLTRSQIDRLTPEEAPPATAPAAAVTAAPAPEAIPAPAPPATAPPPRPVLPAAIEQRFLALRGRPGSDLTYQPALLGLGRVHFVDSRKEVDESEEVALLAELPADVAAVDWYEARQTELRLEDLEDEPAIPTAAFAELSAAAGSQRSYTSWKRAFSDALYRERRLTLHRCPSLKMVSAAGESERDFRIRLGDQAREARDQAVDKLRDKAEKKLDTLAERKRKAEQAVERERDQARDAKLQTAVALGSSLLGALFGGRKRSLSTAVRGVGRSYKQGQDVGRAQENVASYERQMAELQADLEAEIDALKERYDPQLLELDTVEVKPRRTDIEVRLVALAWVPTVAGQPAW